MHLTLQRQTGQYAWYLCKCGMEKYLPIRIVERKLVRSCGCLKKEKMVRNGIRSLKELKRQEVVQIKKLLSDGEKQAYIAYIFKIHQTSVSRIKRGVCSKKLLNI